jgi:hypothetical protein
MNTKFYIIALFAAILIFGSSCRNESEEANFVIEGYKPVYYTKQQVQDIYSTEPVLLENPGKIYIKYPYIYIGESGKGVHVVYSADNRTLTKVAFINIPGNHDIAIKDNIMYADNVTDLVAIDISDFNNVKVVSRVENVYDQERQLFPECTDCYFECVDSTKGYVVEWIEMELTNPKCNR